MTRSKISVPSNKTQPEFTPKMLTLEEIEALRQDNHRRHKANMEMLKTMDLSHLME